MSTNKHVFEDLSAYVDQELSASEVRHVEAHLRTCAQCRRELEALRYTIRMVQAMPPVRAPRSFTISEEQAARIRRPVGAGWLMNALRGMTAVAAVLLLAVCGADFYTMSRLNSQRASAPPVSVFSAPSQSTAQDNATTATDSAKALPTSSTGPASSQPALPPAPQPTNAPASAGAQVAPTGSPTAVTALIVGSPTPVGTVSGPQPAGAAPTGTPANPTAPRPSAQSSSMSPTPNPTIVESSARGSVVPTASITITPTGPAPTATIIPPTATPSPIPPTATATARPTIAPTATPTPLIVAAEVQQPTPAQNRDMTPQSEANDLLPPQRVAELVLLGIVVLGGIGLFSVRMFR